MNNAIMHMRKRRMHRIKPELHSSHAYPKVPTQTTSPWVRRLTANAIDPHIVYHHLNNAGETIRHQTFQSLQRQNGNRYIQRESIGNQGRMSPLGALDEQFILNSPSASATPSPVPIPYPNTSDLTSSNQTSEKVRTQNKSVYTQRPPVNRGSLVNPSYGIHQNDTVKQMASMSQPKPVSGGSETQSQINQSSGDEAGTLKGIASNTNRDKLKYKKYSSKIKNKGSQIRIIPPEETIASRAVDENAVAVGKQGGLVSDQLSNRINRSLGNGSPLPSSKQTQMESKFGTQFSDVRLHTDKEADSFSQQLSARAFTIGSDIFFNHRANPQDSGLLSHELTHVVQQQHMPNNGPMTVGPADDDMEKQADENASSAPANAFTLTFEEQRNQGIQRCMMDHHNQDNKVENGSLGLLGI